MKTKKRKEEISPIVSDRHQLRGRNINYSYPINCYFRYNHGHSRVTLIQQTQSIFIFFEYCICCTIFIHCMYSGGKFTGCVPNLQPTTMVNIAYDRIKLFFFLSPFSFSLMPISCVAQLPNVTLQLETTKGSVNSK